MSGVYPLPNTHRPSGPLWVSPSVEFSELGECRCRDWTGLLFSFCLCSPSTSVLLSLFPHGGPSERTGRSRPTQEWYHPLDPRDRRDTYNLPPLHLGVCVRHQPVTPQTDVLVDRPPDRTHNPRHRTRRLSDSTEGTRSSSSSTVDPCHSRVQSVTVL